MVLNTCTGASPAEVALTKLPGLKLRLQNMFIESCDFRDPWIHEPMNCFYIPSSRPCSISCHYFLESGASSVSLSASAVCEKSMWTILAYMDVIIHPSSHPAIRSSCACTGECTESSCLHIRSEWRVAATHSWHVASTKIYWYTLLRSPSTSPLHHDTPASQLQ